MTATITLLGQGAANDYLARGRSQIYWIGDSILFGSDASPGHDAPTLVGGLLGSSVTCVNVSQAGALLSGDPFETGTLENIARGVDPLRDPWCVRDVLVMEGIVNAIRLATIKTVPQEKAAIVAFTVNRLNSKPTTALYPLQPWRLVMMTCLPFTGATDPAASETTRLAVNLWITSGGMNTDVQASVGYDPGIVVFDQASIAVLSDPTNNTYYVNGLHLNDTGQAVVAQHFVDDVWPNVPVNGPPTP